MSGAKDSPPQDRREPSPQWQRGLLNWSDKAKFWALITVLLGGLLMSIWVATFAVPWLRHELSARPLDEALWLVRVIFGSLALTFFGLGAILTRYAWRVWRYAQAPPPAAWTLFDTPILRGALARQRAAVIAFAACLLLAGAVGLSLFPNAVDEAVRPAATKGTPS